MAIDLKCDWCNREMRPVTWQQLKELNESGEEVVCDVCKGRLKEATRQISKITAMVNQKAQAAVTSALKKVEEAMRQYGVKKD